VNKSDQTNPSLPELISAGSKARPRACTITALEGWVRDGGQGFRRDSRSRQANRGFVLVTPTGSAEVAGGQGARRKDLCPTPAHWESFPRLVAWVVAIMKAYQRIPLRLSA
jgi:hypothetical protein